MNACRTALVVLLPLIAIGGWLVGPTVVHACSADAGWDPIVYSDVIVGGYIQGYTPLPDRGRVGEFIPIRLEMRIDHVWKGNISSGTEIVDRASFMLQPVFTDHEEVRIAWAGSSGACGALNDDPSGQYAVFGLLAALDGTLQTTALRTFYLSPQPYDPAGVRLLSQRIALPVAGNAVQARAAGDVGQEMLLAGAVLWSAGVVMFARRRTNGRSCGAPSGGSARARRLRRRLW